MIMRSDSTSQFVRRSLEDVTRISRGMLLSGEASEEPPAIWVLQNAIGVQSPRPLRPVLVNDRGDDQAEHDKPGEVVEGLELLVGMVQGEQDPHHWWGRRP